MTQLNYPQILRSILQNKQATSCENGTYHRQIATASLRIRAVSPEPLLFADIIYFTKDSAKEPETWPQGEAAHVRLKEHKPLCPSPLSHEMAQTMVVSGRDSNRDRNGHERWRYYLADLKD